MGSDRSSEAALVRPRPRIAPGPELTVVVPTRNERENVAALYERLCAVLEGCDWEVIFVDDDSRDGTARAVRGLAEADRRVRLVHRVGRRGLSSACIEGAQASTSKFVAVMDADLQHDEALLPRMLEVLRGEPVDVVIGSRYMHGGGIGDWDRKRLRISKVATRLGGAVLRVPVSDPMSGYFMIRREAFDDAVRRLSGVGFKILVDVLASSPRPLRVRELPFTFRPRHAGASKLDAFAAWEYLVLLADKTIGHLVPVRFVLFSVVGGIGVLTHLAALWFLLAVAALPFSASQAAAAGIAMVGNFALNNWLTYRDQRLRGWAFARGLVSFVAICGFGAVANVGVATFLYADRDATWWLAGIAGSAISAVWNYAVTSVVTWRRR